VTTVVLVRHGRTTANASGVLAGWTPGVHLDDTGRQQAKELAERLGRLPVDGIVTSPLQRCRETAEILAGAYGNDVPVRSDVDLAECRYGDWTNRPLAELRTDPLWAAVEHVPSTVQFPGGESLAGVQARALASVRRWSVRFGPGGVFLVVSHGDVIKAVLADALGMHLDMFQRIVVEPCSLSAVMYGGLRPTVLRMNDVGGDLAGLRPPAQHTDAARLGGGDSAPVHDDAPAPWFADGEAAGGTAAGDG
jgi:probable phosphoglycerate mutase